jgi:alpha-1,3-mannosyl-glycoprotein beta-1,2-N-acetylglucosaminyltransferase
MLLRKLTIAFASLFALWVLGMGAFMYQTWTTPERGGGRGQHGDHQHSAVDVHIDASEYSSYGSQLPSHIPLVVELQEPHDLADAAPVLVGAPAATTGTAAASVPKVEPVEPASSPLPAQAASQTRSRTPQAPQTGPRPAAQGEHDVLAALYPRVFRPAFQRVQDPLQPAVVPTPAPVPAPAAKVKPEPKSPAAPTAGTASYSSYLFPTSQSDLRAVGGESRFDQLNAHRPSNPAVVVLTHNRVDYLKQCLTNLFAQTRDAAEFTVYVTCDDPNTWPIIARTVEQFKNKFYSVVFSPSMDIDNEANAKHLAFRASKGYPQDPFLGNSYYKIARHYFLALDYVLREKGHSHVVILEDDLKMAPDALYYFYKTASLLNEDGSLMCVSAWNDNGLKTAARDQTRLFRTDFFPGLGWMMAQKLWTEELREKWPVSATTGWDHWLRTDIIHKGRECVAPEVPRVQHVSKEGTNVQRGASDVFKRYALADALPASVANVASEGFGDLSYLLQDNWERLFAAMIEHGASHPADPRAQVRLVLQRGGHWYRNWSKFRVWSNPGARGTYKGAILTRMPAEGGGQQLQQVVLVDTNWSPHIPADQRTPPQDDVQVVGGARGASCAKACADKGLRCLGLQIEHFNRCSVLQEVFGCDTCGYEVGKEIPCLVVDHETIEGMCLTTDQPSNDCNTAHRNTRRLCPCA